MIAGEAAAGRIGAASAVLTFSAAGMLLAGCYVYTPVESRAVEPGTVVRARLTPEGGARFADPRGLPRSAVEGAAVRTRDDTIALAMWSSGSAATAVSAPDTVAVPLGLVTGVERKELSTVRTAALAVGGASALGLLVARAFDAAGGRVSGEGGGADDRTVVPARSVDVPVIRLRW